MPRLRRPPSSRSTCWSRRPPRPSPSRSASGSTTRWRCTSTDLCTIPANLAGNAGDVACRAGSAERPAGRAADHGAGAGRRAAATAWARRSRPSSTPAAEVRCAVPCAVTRSERPMTITEVATTVRAGHRPRDPRRARHRVQDVLRLLDGVRRRAQHPHLPGLPGPARRAAGGQRGGDRVAPSGSGSR